MITPQEATLMRLNLLTQLQNDPFVDIRQENVDKMFTDSEHLERWAKGSNTQYEKFNRPDYPTKYSRWMRFRKLTPMTPEP